MVLNEPLLEYLPFEGRDAGVEGGQLPQRHNLVAHAAACVLAGLRVGVHVVLTLARLLERNL